MLLSKRDVCFQDRVFDRGVVSSFATVCLTDEKLWEDAGGGEE